MSRPKWIAKAALAAGLAGLTIGCGGSGMGDGVRRDITERMAGAEQPLSACYKQALERRRKLAGSMVVRFDAAANTGQFSNVQVVRSEVDDPDLTRCVVATVSGLKLSQPQKTVVSVEYPVNFTPAR